MGIICQHCYHFLPDEQFISNIENDEEPYMGCCKKCQIEMFGENKGYLRRKRGEQINCKTVYDYKCNCGYILKVRKHSMYHTIKDHERSNRHNFIVNGSNIKNEVQCLCGAYTTKQRMKHKKHIDTKRHQKYLKSLN